MRETYDCEEFLEFGRTFGEAVAADLLQEACEAFYGTRDRGREGRVDRHSKESHDREGANHTFKGTIDHGARCWYFEIEDGNSNGTVVHTWERSWKHGGYPLPQFTAWAYASMPLYMVRMIIDRNESFLSSQFKKLLSTSQKSG